MLFTYYQIAHLIIYFYLISLKFESPMTEEVTIFLKKEHT